MPLAFSLAACGGSNIDNIVVSDPISDDALNNRIGELADAYVNDYENGNFASAVPTTGRATMSGAILLGGPGIVDGTNLDVANVVGQIDVSVDFASNEVDGIASDFRFNDGTDIEGELILEADILRDGDAGIAGTLTGTLINDFDDPFTLEYDIDGNFMGAGASGLVAGGTGIETYLGNVYDAGVVFAAD